MPLFVDPKQVVHRFLVLAFPVVRHANTTTAHAPNGALRLCLGRFDLVVNGCAGVTQLVERQCCNSVFGADALSVPKVALDRSVWSPAGW